MSPGSRRIPIATKVVEAAMVNLITTEIRHISLMFAEETIYNETRQTSFFKCLSQNGFFGALIRFDSSRRNLNPRFKGKGVNEDK